MAIRVRAFREGFHKGKRRRIGAEFNVPEGTLESGWFAPVDPSVKLAPRPNPNAAEKSAARRKRDEERRRQLIETARIKAEGRKPPEDEPVALSELGRKARPTAREAVVEKEDPVA